MLKINKQFLYNPICMGCGSFFVQDHLFCTPCFQNFIHKRLDLKVSKMNEKCEHAFLFDWMPGESNLLSEMVYRFKSDRCTKAWEFYSDFLARAIADQMDISAYHAIVPMPGSKTNSVHAHIFAKNLSGLWGLPVLNTLYKKPVSKEQKLKTAAERLERSAENSIRRLEQFTKDDVSNLNLIYVDDVMTTGATFKSAKTALENKRPALLVTLFYRPKAN